MLLNFKILIAIADQFYVLIYEPFRVSHDRPCSIDGNRFDSFLYRFVGVGVWWISAQAVSKNIVSFPRYSIFSESTLLKKLHFLWFFLIWISLQKFFHLSWNIRCQPTASGCIFPKRNKLKCLNRERVDCNNKIHEKFLAFCDFVLVPIGLNESYRRTEI